MCQYFMKLLQVNYLLILLSVSSPIRANSYVKQYLNTAQNYWNQKLYGGACGSVKIARMSANNSSMYGSSTSPTLLSELEKWEKKCNKLYTTGNI